MNLHEIRKAIVALLVPIITALVARVGLDATPELTAALTSVVSAILVWAIPNRPPAE